MQIAEKTKSIGGNLLARREFPSRRVAQEFDGAPRISRAWNILCAPLRTHGMCHGGSIQKFCFRETLAHTRPANTAHKANGDNYMQNFRESLVPAEATAESLGT